MGNGEKMTGNLSNNNVYRDEGEVELTAIIEIEQFCHIKFSNTYVEFIMKHNGARLDIDSFDFYDCVHGIDSSESIAFINIRKIRGIIDDLLEQSTDDEDCPDVFKFYKYFDNKLIPFGDTGGGDLICFDYRQHNGDNPPIVLWCHDDCDENWNRISFIAHNFEEFINMLHEPEDI